MIPGELELPPLLCGKEAARCLREGWGIGNVGWEAEGGEKVTGVGERW